MDKTIYRQSKVMGFDHKVINLVLNKATFGLSIFWRKQLLDEATFWRSNYLTKQLFDEATFERTNFGRTNFWI